MHVMFFCSHFFPPQKCKLCACTLNRYAGYFLHQVEVEMTQIGYNDTGKMR